jgi:hypothetical protein
MESHKDVKYAILTVYLHSLVFVLKALISQYNYESGVAYQ